MRASANAWGRDYVQQAKRENACVQLVLGAVSWATTAPLQSIHDGCAKGLSAVAGLPHFSSELEFCMLALWLYAVS